MSTVHAVKLAGPTQVTGTTSVTIYTVPSGFRGLVRSMRFANNSSASSADVSTGVGGSAVANRVARRTILANASATDDGWMVLDAGDTLVVTSHGSQTVTVAAFGYELELP